jgi:hypothetical protein
MAARVSEEAQKWSDEKYSLFFYGTLLHPAVLKRVLGHEGSGLSHQPAALYVSLIVHTILGCSDITILLLLGRWWSSYRTTKGTV